MEALTIVIPVYNEGANFPALWESLSRQVRAEFSAVVVYDFPGDDTVPVAKQIIARGENRLRLLDVRHQR